jgi:type II secretory ATPase GspE/PulE/Tfp pilus assembly ATPase PilB-like protein
MPDCVMSTLHTEQLADRILHLSDLGKCRRPS